ncbi:DMT family transporter [Salibacterium halotolerans]|uniref:Threonine/homoserine efflux transporter RhtA n=1 Tax=Salibacterium halotolerans TaxID=1884432 RepID=A0A1I5PC66_9BACI|nr:DMT family transporter [Salibacterium halotolerans]SFP31692.1 Threonine/homoserine efflux transporter RhtA [Salibacterium halotolerans]
MNMRQKADVMMVMVTFFWGSSYVFMKMGLGSMEVFNLIALRFGTAFLFAGLIFHKRLRRTDGRTILSGMILGFLLYLMFSFITAGVQTTSAANAGFIVSLAVIFVPLLSFVLFKQKISLHTGFGIVLALFGVAVLTLKLQLETNPGDLLCMLGALSYAVYILTAASLTNHFDTIRLGVIQLGFAGLFGFMSSMMSSENFVLPGSAKAWIAVLALGIVCSAVGFTVQTISQKYTTPTNTGLIFSLEPLFAAVFAMLMLGEELTTKSYIGAAFIMAGVMLSRIDIKKWIQSRIRTA